MNGEQHVLAHAGGVLGRGLLTGDGGVPLGPPLPAVEQDVAGLHARVPVVGGPQGRGGHRQSGRQEDVSVEAPIEGVKAHLGVVGRPRDADRLAGGSHAFSRRTHERVPVQGDAHRGLQIERLAGDRRLRRSGCHRDQGQGRPRCQVE